VQRQVTLLAEHECHWDKRPSCAGSGSIGYGRITSSSQCERGTSNKRYSNIGAGLRVSQRWGNVFRSAHDYPAQFHRAPGQLLDPHIGGIRFFSSSSLMRWTYTQAPERQGKTAGAHARLATSQIFQHTSLWSVLQTDRESLILRCVPVEGFLTVELAGRPGLYSITVRLRP